MDIADERALMSWKKFTLMLFSVERSESETATLVAENEYHPRFVKAISIC
jgi:hypothetical protein